MPTTTKSTKQIYIPRRAPSAAAQTPANSTQLLSSPVNVATGSAVVSSRAPATQTCCCPACSGLECLDRTRFFAGQLLTEADLNNEQSYWLAKSRLHNRYLVGWGVVCGLQVVCSECDGWVTVKSGYAIDPCGNDIIVCSDQSFNVLNAIKACCTPTQQTANCAPLRYTPPAECQNVPQKWCITIEYQEQQSRMVTPLVQASSKSCSCSAGGSNGGCGCGCGGSKSSNGPATSSCGCSSQQAQATTTTSTGACEATRILEGFRLGICAAPANTVDQKTPAPAPGTFLYQYDACVEGLEKLSGLAPAVNANMDVNTAYQSACSYLVTVNQYFAQTQFLTQCQLLDALAEIPIPTPANGGTIATYASAVQSIQALVLKARIDCLCNSLLPVCPPDPCTKKVGLACVTVQDGAITNICPFECRQQLIGITALNYWLGPVFADIGQLLAGAFEGLCCTSARDVVKGNQQYAYPSQYAYDTTNVTTAGLSDPAMFNRIFTSILSQKLGAAMVNVLSPQAKAVDLSTLVGQSSTGVQDLLQRQGFKTVTIQDTTGNPAWNADAITAAAQFAPTAVSVGQPVTVFTQGNVIVGAAVTNPTTVLQNQITELQQQVAALQNPSAPPTSQPPSSSRSSAKDKR